MSLREWALAALLHHWPVERVPVMPGHEETRVAMLERYEQIVDAVVLVAEEEPAVPGGLSDRSEVALLLAIAIGESGLAKDADVGPCFQGDGHERRCDRGRSASAWQVWASAWKLHPGDLFNDRTLAARIALRAARGSIALCRKKGLPAVDGLSALSGRCIRNLKPAQSHYHRWNAIAAWEPR